MADETSLKSRTGNAGAFYIEELPDSFRLHNVPYDGSLAVLTWDKEYLDGGRRYYAQRELANISDEVPDILAYHATITSLAQNRKGPQSALVKKVSMMFKKDFQNDRMATSTRIIYRPSGKDEIVHNYGSERETIVKVEFVGLDLFITAKSGLEEQMEALLRTRNLQEIERNYFAFSGKKPYLWSVNSRPTQDTEIAVWVGIYTDWFYLGCNLNSISSLGRVRGVRVESAAGARAENEGQGPYRTAEKTPEEVLEEKLVEILSPLRQLKSPATVELYDRLELRALRELTELYSKK